MTVSNLPVLASDRIQFRRDPVRAEDSSLWTKYFRPCAGPVYAVSIALNTWYPEITGGYYMNRRILRTIGAVLEFCSLWISISDSSGGEFIAAEDAITLLEEKEYVLVDKDGTTHGSAYLWESQGHVDAFYADNCILELRLPTSVSEKFEEFLASTCLREKIGVERMPDVPRERSSRNLFRKPWSKNFWRKQRM
jgi:hypothetical protein